MKKYSLSKYIKQSNSLLFEKEKEKKSNSQTPPKRNIRINHNKIKEKILLINLDDTLIHYSNNIIEKADLIIPDENENNHKNKKNKYILFHPGLIPFIEEISNYYEIIIFTNLTSSIGETILNSIDPQNRIKIKLYSDIYKLEEKKILMKDLNYLGDSRNIILLDNSYPPIYNELNRIPIKVWFDDIDDLQLYKLIPILKNLNGFYDVKTEICKFVQNNKFIWKKAISWIKENLLNTTYLNYIENILKKEKENLEMNSLRKKKNMNNKIFNKNNTVSDIYENFNKILNFKSLNNIKKYNKNNIKNSNSIKIRKKSNEFNNNNILINNKIFETKNDINDKENDFDKDILFRRLETEENKSYKKSYNKYINHTHEKLNIQNIIKGNIKRSNSMSKKKNFQLLTKPVLSSLKGIVMKKTLQDKKLNISQDNVLFQMLKNKKNITQNLKNSKIHLSNDKIQKANPYKFISKNINNRNKSKNQNLTIKKRGNHFSSFSINLSNSISNSHCK